MASRRPVYHQLDPANTDPARIRREREKARELKKTSWWNQQLQRGICHYCEKRFKPNQLTMDHVVPLARGGVSARGNIVAACGPCNQQKKLDTPVEQLLDQLSMKSAADAGNPDDADEADDTGDTGDSDE